MHDSFDVTVIIDRHCMFKKMNWFWL